jgi:hypothetical protein
MSSDGNNPDADRIHIGLQTLGLAASHISEICGIMSSGAFRYLRFAAEALPEPSRGCVLTSTINSVS